VISDRVCPGVDRPSGVRGERAGVKSDRAEVVSEARLHERPRRRIKRGTGCMQHVVESAGDSPARRAVDCRTLEVALGLALVTTVTLSFVPASARPL
jgi:hypothetical protein